MYKIEQEILSQYKALEETFIYMMGMKSRIESFTEKTRFKSITFIGCGSSYSLCKSAEISYKLRTGLLANSIAAGDLLLNFSTYKRLLKDTLLVVLSRSGSTNEVVSAVEMAKNELEIPCISISTRERSKLGSIADLNIELPWAFDESVCETRTVTNLYTANLMLTGLMIDDKVLLDEIGKAVKAGELYIEQSREVLKEAVYTEEWEKVVVLADSELSGIAEVGALTFSKICRMPANFYHVLDVRHGPMVLINDKTLVIIACAPDDNTYQMGLIEELKEKGAVVVTVGTKDAKVWGSDYNIMIPHYSNFGVNGIPFILVPQLLSCLKAQKFEVN